MQTRRAESNAKGGRLLFWSALLAGELLVRCVPLAALPASMPKLEPATISRARSFQAGSAELNMLIDRLQKKYSRMQGLQADFVQIYIGPEGRVLRESGRLLLKRPRKARWDYQEPEKKVFVSDGSSVFFYVEGEQHATKSDVKESGDPQIPFLFLLSQGNLRRDFSRIEIASQEKPTSPDNIVLKLTPKRAPDAFKQIMAEIDPVSVEVRRLVVLEQNGSRMDFRLNNVREGVAIADAEFRFTPPPGVTIVKATGR